MKRCIFTICASNYIAQALTLARSVRRSCHGVEFFIYLIDDCPAEISEDHRKLIRQAKELFGEKWEELAFRYNVVELATTVKPFAFGGLFYCGFDHIIYLDPDIEVHAPLDPIFELLDSHDVVVTPHFCSLEPIYDGGVPLPQILWVGSFNCGFIAVRRNGVGGQVVAWWQERLFSQGFADRFDALHVDQKWMDLLPCLLPAGSFHILRHIGCNAAFWNLHERELVQRGDRYFVRGKKADLAAIEEPLLFFHFSGYDPTQPDVLHQRHREFDVTRVPSFQRLFSEYAAMVLELDYTRFMARPYKYDYYSNGVAVTRFARRIYRALKENGGYVGHVFFDAEAPDGFYALLKRSGLLVEDYTPQPRRRNIKGVKSALVTLERILKLALRLLGPRRYGYLIQTAGLYGRHEAHAFLIRGYSDLNERRKSW